MGASEAELKFSLQLSALSLSLVHPQIEPVRLASAVHSEELKADG
jgi:hypothetical protein